MNPIVHFEIPVDDIERAKNFYTKIFGWEIEKFDMPADGSTGGDPYYSVRCAETDEKNMVKEPGSINGGMMKRKDPRQPFMNYITVDSIDDKIKEVEENDGKVIMPKTEIAPGMGFIAAFQDTENNIMGLHELSENMKTSS
ncbi:VOC family protein [Candidatus Nomurabacteria bacterium]|nr:VOC family protein [Candidatus Nomurabacteria bacterium]